MVDCWSLGPLLPGALPFGNKSQRLVALGIHLVSDDLEKNYGMSLRVTLDKSASIYFRRLLSVKTTQGRHSEKTRDEMPDHSDLNELIILVQDRAFSIRQGRLTEGP